MRWSRIVRDSLDLILEEDAEKIEFLDHAAENIREEVGIGNHCKCCEKLYKTKGTEQEGQGREREVERDREGEM